MYCSYYQAHAVRNKIWFIAGSFRNESNVVFDRSLDDEKGILEFFVPQDQEEHFLSIARYFQDKGLLFDLKKLPNRLQAGEPLQ